MNEEAREAEQAEQAAPESEVRADEFTRGIEKPVGESTFTEAVVEALRQPLDPNRIRSRAGRGSGRFEYLAGHDVKRRANEIFGFGNWGSELVELREEVAVAVASKEGKEGWHVAYRAIVRVTLRGGMPVSDVGYGDGVEYGPAALATCRELAMKEASTDALKRALTQLGDQFGLILYAKADEKKRIESDANADGAQQSSRSTVRNRQERVTTPRSWAQINEWADAYGPEIGWMEWAKQASMLLYNETQSALLTTTQRGVVGQKASGAIIALREAVDPTRMPPPSRGEIQAAWATVLDGIILPGPEWRIDPGDAYPTYAEYHTVTDETQGTGGEDVPPDESESAEDIPFGDDAPAETPTDAT